mmetsp:Transcript_15640/g.34006  ORF Transcript_15640/g.34006 Transcript_15640/m.34006 type:complete len:225 (-) Transcript_15640:293-967(-)
MYKHATTNMAYRVQNSLLNQSVCVLPPFLPPSLPLHCPITSSFSFCVCVLTYTPSSIPYRQMIYLRNMGASRHSFAHPFQTLLLILEGWFLAGNVPIGNDVAKLGHPLGISSLVVVPGVDLNESAIDNLSRQSVNDTAAGIVGVVGGNQGFLFVTEDALERTALGCCLEGGIDLLLGRWLLNLKDAVGQGGVEEGDADGKTVKLALELGVDLHDGGGTTGGGGT